MPISKETRRSRHQNSETPELGRGNPSSKEGRVGSQQFRNIKGKGLVHLVRDDSGWKEVGSSQKNTNKGNKVSSSSIGAGISASNSDSLSTGGSVAIHGNLTYLDSDDHTQYVHNTSARTISGNHNFTGTPIFTGIDINGGDIASGTTINKSPVVTLAGDLGGNATFSNLGNATLTATIQPNSVALTTDTTGNYMSNVTGNSQVSVSHSQGEGSTAALSIAGDSIGDTQLAYNTGQHLTTSSAPTFATVNTGQGANELYDMNQNVLTTSSPQFSNMTLGEYSSPNYSNGEIGTSTFASGFTGTGWKMSKSGNEYNLETNNMMIRGTLSVYELLIQQIRASNGAIFVSSSAKVESASSLSASDDNGTITFEDPSNNNICPFAANDLIMMQRINPGSLVANNAAGGATNVIKKLVYKVSSVSGKTITVESGGYNNTSFPSEGDDFVRIGNTSNADRQGIIYLTSDDTNSPFIDIKSDIDSYSDWTGSTPKVRLGKLNGITDSDLGGNLSGFGLYSNNIFLKGKIVANSGSIGGWSLSASAITGSNIVMSSNGTIAVANGYTLNNDGSASFANGGITFATNGDITSNTFLLERTRLFGAGEDGTVVLYAGTCDATYKVSSTQINSQHGQSIITRSGSTWSMQGDCYFDTLTISSTGGALVLNTNGFRLFVKNTFTIASSCYVSCNGSSPSGYDDGDAHGGGSASGTLSRGAQGHAGGAVGSKTGSGGDGGRGGASGGGGGIVFISARIISNSGYIHAKGGNGHAGQQGGSD
tara:strand:- start:145 stop:2448 length:2304 start_codon:yes stop_codon:yes gene_type:complete